MSIRPRAVTLSMSFLVAIYRVPAYRTALSNNVLLLLLAKMELLLERKPDGEAG